VLKKPIKKQKLYAKLAVRRKEKSNKSSLLRSPEARTNDHDFKCEHIEINLNKKL